ncbi:MAG TPA: hypothetical protein VI112_17320 [Bacteroidia bacterium]|jgi:hypothetical protein
MDSLIPQKEITVDYLLHTTQIKDAGEWDLVTGRVIELERKDEKGRSDEGGSGELENVR